MRLPTPTLACKRPDPPASPPRLGSFPAVFSWTASRNIGHSHTLSFLPFGGRAGRSLRDSTKGQSIDLGKMVGGAGRRDRSPRRRRLWLIVVIPDVNGAGRRDRSPRRQRLWLIVVIPDVNGAGRRDRSPRRRRLWLIVVIPDVNGTGRRDRSRRRATHSCCRPVANRAILWLSSVFRSEARRAVRRIHRQRAGGFLRMSADPQKIIRRLERVTSQQVTGPQAASLWSQRVQVDRLG